ncbi:hypothetical protein KIPB_016178, partial [Kipferlia bialata]|eukprot:g16178.t1
MELIDGCDLEEYISEHLQTSMDTPVPHVLSIIRQILLGLVDIHAQRIIHRDLKPDNILVGEKDGLPLVKITDLGLCKPMDYGESVTDTVNVGNALYR